MAELEENKEVEQTTFSKDDYLKSQEFIDFINGEKGKAVNKWKEEQLEKLVEEEIKRRQTKTPEQLAIEEQAKRAEKLEKELSDMKRENTREKLGKVALQKATEYGIPLEIVENFVDSDLESTNKNLEKLKTVFENYSNKIKGEIYKNHSSEVPGGTEIFNQSESDKSFEGLSKEEIKKRIREKIKNKSQ